MYNQQNGSFEVKKGPIFSNLVLADEVQPILQLKYSQHFWEAMQEKSKSLSETRFHVDQTILVLATQNSGGPRRKLMPLPEAQVDRFMMKVHIDFLAKRAEWEMEVSIRNWQIWLSAQDVNPILTKQDVFISGKWYQRREMARATRALHHWMGICHSIFPGAYGLKDEAKVDSGLGYRHELRYLNFESSFKSCGHTWMCRDYVLPGISKKIAWKTCLISE